MIDRGVGPPVVLIPGLQGRWEWMAPAVDALASRCRVITFSLADEPTSGFAFDAGAEFEGYVTQVREALDRAQIERAVILGVSFGGLIATAFAARYPERVSALVLASALPLDWTPDARARFYARAPRLLSPVFFVGAPMRLLPELRTALTFGGRARFLSRLLVRLVRSPLSPARMARRVAWIERRAVADVTRMHAPVLLITGENRLDRIVSPSLSRRYLECFPQAHHVTLDRTGHVGLVTRPAAFAELVFNFVDGLSADAKRISA